MIGAGLEGGGAMPTRFQELLADASRSETAFMVAVRRSGLRLMAVNLEYCPVHPQEPLQRNYADLWICNHPDHRPNRGDDD